MEKGKQISFKKNSNVNNVNGDTSTQSRRQEAKYFLPCLLHNFSGVKLNDKCKPTKKKIF